MATITTKAELKAAVANYTLRPTLDYDLLLAQAEESINPKLLAVRERSASGEKFKLVDDNATNWLLVNAQHVYFRALLVEALLQERNADEANLWQARLQDAIDDLLWENARTDSQATLAVDPALILIPGRLPNVFNIETGDYGDTVAGGSSGSELILD